MSVIQFLSVFNCKLVTYLIDNFIYWSQIYCDTCRWILDDLQIGRDIATRSDLKIVVTL